MEVVEVIWEDIVGDNSVRSKLDVVKDTPKLAHTMGFLVKKDKNKLVIASTEYEDKDLSDTNTIPIGCVVKIREYPNYEPSWKTYKKEANNGKKTTKVS